MKTLVVYYSNTGNNKFLAEKISQALKGDIEAIKARMNLFPFLMLFTLLKASLGIKSLVHKVDDYDSIVLCGPIWMGQLISPLHDFIHKYLSNIKRLHFATCCGGSDAAQDDKFGYASVFQNLKNAVGDRCAYCEAFPIGLVFPEDQQREVKAIMKMRLSNANFAGQIQKRFELFIQNVAG
jgi:menaquinone-dependent protoporphyrinogen IX oxidase